MNKLFLIILTVFLSSISNAQPGTLDPTFNPGTGPNNIIRDMKRQSDGKIIIVGDFTQYNGIARNRIARLNADGSLDNTFNVGTGIVGNANFVLIQPDGKIIVSGKTSPGVSSYNGTTTNGIARINTDGSLDNTFNVGSGANNTIRDIVLQSDGKLIVVGFFSTFNSVARRYLVRLNSNGSVDMSYDLGSTNTGSGIWQAEIQQDGKLVIGGFFNDHGVSVGPIARLNIDGSHDNTFTSTNYTWAPFLTAMELQANGKILVSGESNILGQFTPNGDDIDVINYDPYNALYDIKELPDGRVLIGGSFSYTNGSITKSGFAILKPNLNIYTWINVVAPGLTYAIDVEPSGNILVAGSFIKRILMCHSSTNTINASVCNSYTLNGQTYLSSGTYNQTISNAAGCDSIITLNLTLLNNSGTDNQTACNSFTWINGNTYTSSTNTPTFTLTNSQGCDSVVTLHLTINNGTIGIDTQTACNSYTWIDGNTYTASTNTPTFTLTNSQACDSVVTLHLTINNSVTGTDAQIACESYTWIDGITYNSSTNAPTWALTNQAGCDSIVTLNLTILNSTTGTDIQTACDSYTWIDGNTYNSSTNIPAFTLTNSVGCDSIVTLNLTILNPSSGTDTQITCESVTWIDGNTYISSTNTPTFNLTNAVGCDSIVTLNLTIIPDLPTVVESGFSMPSDANNCLGEFAIDISGNPDFELNIDNGAQTATTSAYDLFTGLCPGVHDLQIINFCGDTTETQFVIPVDSNYVFNNPFIDSLAQDSLGTTIENCDIYYAGIDTAYIDSIWATGNTVNVIWNIVDSNGSNFDTTSYELNNGNGVYWLQLSVFCPTKALGDYFAVTEAIYFEDGNISTAGISEDYLDSLVLYPNPTNDLVTISFDGNNAHYIIYDAQGKLIQTSTIVSGGTVSLKDVQTGVYFFELTTENGRTVKRVVKN